MPGTPRTDPYVRVNAYGSYLECVTANRWAGHGWRMETRGHSRPHNASSRSHEKRSRCDRLRRARSQSRFTRGRECLDFRAISGRWPVSFAQGGVVYEPEDLDERLDWMRLGGESETVEFKEAVPDGDRIARAVAAFSNGSGGTIIIGIRDGTGEVVGITGDAAGARDRLDNIVRNNVSPPPEYDLSTRTLEGRTVIAMRVAPGDRRPYGVSAGGGIVCYVRRGANNWAAGSDEIRVIARPRQSNDEAAFSPWQ